MLKKYRQGHCQEAKEREKKEERRETSSQCLRFALEIIFPYIFEVKSYLVEVNKKEREKDQFFKISFSISRNFKNHRESTSKDIRTDTFFPTRWRPSTRCCSIGRGPSLSKDRETMGRERGGVLKRGSRRDLPRLYRTSPLSCFIVAGVGTSPLSTTKRTLIGR